MECNNYQGRVKTLKIKTDGGRKYKICTISEKVVFIDETKSVS